jgi:hypothetical protein
LGTLCATRGLVRISRKDNKSINFYLERRTERTRHPNEARIPRSASEKPTFALLLFWDEPELLQYAQVIVCFPLLDYLAVLDALDSDAFDFHLSASGRAELFSLSLVGTTYGIAAYRLITLAYHVFDTDVENFTRYRVRRCAGARDSRIHC